MTAVVRLPTGAEARVRNEEGPLAAILLNGGTSRPLPGTWSATTELLATALAPRFPDVRFVEVRYRVKTWRALGSCVDDARAALELALAGGAERCLLVGFSMGGAVSVRSAGHDAVLGVLGLAPWLPEQLELDGIRGKRLDVLHGAWDRPVLGIPGVSPASSRAAYERALALGAVGTYEVIPRALHGCAVRAPSGGLIPLPRRHAWVSGAAAVVERFRRGQYT